MSLHRLYDTSITSQDKKQHPILSVKQAVLKFIVRNVPYKTQNTKNFPNQSRKSVFSSREIGPRKQQNK